jgi:hypothetical protein
MKENLSDKNSLLIFFFFLTGPFYLSITSLLQLYPNPDFSILKSMVTLSKKMKMVILF